MPGVDLAVRSDRIAELGPGEIATPAVSDGTLYVAHGDPSSGDPYRLIAIDVVTGVERWRWTAPTKNRLFVGGVEGATVYAASEDGSVYAIDRVTGLGRPFFVTQGPVGSLTAIVDGIVGMEGDGPLNGVAKPFGALIMGHDLVAVDATCCRLMMLDPDKIGYLVLGAMKKLGRSKESEIAQLGETIASLAQAFDTVGTYRGAIDEEKIKWKRDSAKSPG